MGSRRTTTTRSASWNGRSSNGDDTNGSSRPSSYSYISNVRPVNRSTLCSVMAQLTEETQPFFETTLKSKAVSESSNVKFSCVVTGYPTPQVNWYKDEMQLDRFCGLPKYEIFHNGKNHSLQIYNCTVEDAAIYQASAINNKGIVSCSGVLEVGEMNEFKIHQRYFEKLKQKAENRRREAEGKENLEPLRTISPDRIQRKRRSTMEAFLSMPGSMEDEGDEESHQPVAVENETRLQVATVENTEEKPVTHGQAVNENGNKAGTCHNDTAQMIFTAYQPKTPFVKKKIKISNSAKVAKADKLGEKTPEERRAKDKTSTPAALACRDSLQSKGNSEKVMKKAVNSSIMDSDSKNVTEQHLKSVNEEAKLVERPSKDGNVSQRKQVTGPVSPVPLTSTSYSASGTDGKRVAKHEKEAGHKDTEKNLEVQKQSPCLDPNFTSTQLHSTVASTLLSILKEDIIKTEDDKAMDIDEKSDTSTGAPLAHKDLKSVNTPCESRTALPQRPCEQAGDLLSEKETSPCQENMSKSQPALLSEVTQAHTKMNRNDAPVNLEPPPDQCTTNTQPPQKTTSEREITTDDGKTLSLHRGLQAAIDKRTQDKWDHSRRSNERPMVLFTDQQNSPLASPNGGENIRECNVSSTALQCKVDTAVKTVEGTEIQVDRKIEGKKIDKSLVQADNVAPKGKVVETESVALRMVEQTETEETRDSLDKDAGCVIVEESCKEENEPLSKMAEESSSELQNVKPDDFETVLSHLTNNPENANKLEQIIGFNEITKPVSKVISIAELLRSQIKSLDHTLADSVPTIPVLADFVQEPTTTATETCQELINDNGKCKPEVKKSLPDTKTETITDNNPPEDTKETLVEVYHQLSKTDQDQIKTQDETSPPVQSLQKPFDIETTGLHSSARKYNEGLTDIVQQTGASNLVPSIDFPVVSLSESENVKHIFFPSASKDELSNRPKSISNLSGTVSEGSGTPVKASRKESITECSLNEPVQGKDVEVIQKLTAEINLNSKTESGITEMNSTTILDQCKIEEHDTNRSSLKDVQRFPSPSLFSTDTQENNIKPPQQDCSMFEDFSRSESLTNPAPEDIPLVKKRNCVSPIPSATAQELASGARRKILITKAKPEEAASAIANQAQKKEIFTQNSKLSTSLVTPSMSPILSRRSPLLQPAGERTSPVEKRSPLLSRRRTESETQAPSQQPSEEVPTPKTEGKPKEKEKHDPFRAPQVIRKMRGETFADASGHLKLWCQFFNVLSDSTIKWYKNEEEIAQMKRSAGDETQVNLAIVQASSRDSGVYGCSITNEYGTDSTDTLLSGEILAGMSLREDLGVGEEIEMTPLIFNKGVADSGIWGNKLFGRIMMQESHIGDGCSHKVWRAKVIYGLEPVFESGNTCIIKVRNPIAYGGKEESCLIERNLTIVKQECKIQNLAREYCKIFSAEARGIENFGPSLEVVPVYLMYRPANTVPYATVEVDLTGDYQKYSVLDHTGRIDMRTGSKVEEKCCALQHWIFQWTNGNLLLTRLEGVDTKITNVGISVKSTGHQGLSVEGNPKVFEEFVSQHQCNYFCGLLGLRSLKVMDSLLTPTKPKGSRSPLLQRKMAAGSSSPQTGRKAVGSPRLPRKTEQEGGKTPTKQKATDAPNVVKMA